MMKAAVLHKVGDLRYEEIPIPKISEGEALIKVKAAGICNSDIPRVKSSGAYLYPIVLGHEFCGVVEKRAAGENHGVFQAGSRVAVFPLIPCKKCPYCEKGEFAQCNNYDYLGSRANGGFSEYVKVPVWNLLKIPDNVGFEEAALAEPVAVGLHAIRRFGVDIGDKVVVYGAGTIGLALVAWAKIHGAGKVVLVDIMKEKLDYAKKLYDFVEIINAGETEPVKELKRQSNELGFDLAIESAGSSVSFEQCIRSVRKFGKVVFMGNIHTDVVLPQATVSNILRNQIYMTGTWNSSFAALPKNEWKITLDYISNGQLNVKNFISHRFKLKDCNKAFDMMASRKEFFNKVMFMF